MKIFSWINRKLWEFSQWLDKFIFTMYIHQLKAMVDDKHMLDVSASRMGMRIIGEMYAPITPDKLIKVYFVQANRFLKYMFPEDYTRPLGLTMMSRIMSKRYAIIVFNDATYELNGTLNNAVVFHELGHIVKEHFKSNMLGNSKQFISELEKEFEADEYAAQAGYGQQLQNVLADAFASLPFHSKDIPALRERLVKVIEFEIDHPGIPQQQLYLLQ